jgi:uncharacterized membrane protein YccC
MTGSAQNFVGFIQGVGAGIPLGFLATRPILGGYSVPLVFGIAVLLVVVGIGLERYAHTGDGHDP